MGLSQGTRPHKKALQQLSMLPLVTGAGEARHPSLAPSPFLMPGGQVGVGNPWIPMPSFLWMAVQGPWGNLVSLWVFTLPYLMEGWRLSELLLVEVVGGAQEVVEKKWGGEQLWDLGGTVFWPFSDPRTQLALCQREIFCGGH